MSMCIVCFGMEDPMSQPLMYF